MLKTNNCNDLNRCDIGKKVKLAGWVDRRRDLGQLIFIDLRDRSGIVQTVFNPEISKFSHEIGSQLRSEFVVQVTGTVNARPSGTINPKLATGEIEVLVEDAVILNTAKTPPFYINEDIEIKPELIRCASSVIDEQVTNGIAVRMAILYLIIGGNKDDL